jgi:hypothetical protein
LVYRIKIGIVLLLIVGLMFGCGGDDAATDDGRDYVHGEEDSSEFEAAADNLGVVFDDPVAAGRPSPSFSADISPILTNRCALPGCHVAGGPYGIDLRTYDSLKAGGEDGAIVIVGNAKESEMVEEIVEGKMPPDGPPLEAAQVQLIIDWINEGAKNN